MTRIGRQIFVVCALVMFVCTSAAVRASSPCTDCYIACMFEDDHTIYKEAFAKSSFRGWSLYILRNKVEDPYPTWGPACRFELDFVDKDTLRTTTITETDLSRAELARHEGIQLYKPRRSGPPYAFRLKVDSTKPHTVHYGYSGTNDEPARVPDWYVLKASSE